MCGIVTAIARRNIVPVLLEGLRKLEYRGYDSAGLAVLKTDGTPALQRLRAVGRVAELTTQVEEADLELRFLGLDGDYDLVPELSSEMQDRVGVRLWSENQRLGGITRLMVLSNIATLLGVSVNTVQTHIKNTYAKLAVRSRGLPPLRIL